jgi:hypothetical protein
MATDAIVVRVWEDGDFARMAVRVTEDNAMIGPDGEPVATEYIGAVSIAAFDALPNAAAKKAALAAAVKAVRDADPAVAATSEQAITGITGTVSI